MGLRSFENDGGRADTFLQQEVTRRRFITQGAKALAGLYLASQLSMLTAEEAEASPALLRLNPNTRYPITLANRARQVVYTSPSIDVSGEAGYSRFESYPFTNLGYLYWDSPQNNNSKQLFIYVHSGGANRTLPGDYIVRNESSFYGGPVIKVGSQNMKIKGIEVVNVEDVLDDDQAYSGRVINTANNMPGANRIITCYPPYIRTPHLQGLLAGKNVLLITGDAV